MGCAAEFGTDHAVAALRRFSADAQQHCDTNVTALPWPISWQAKYMELFHAMAARSATWRCLGSHHGLEDRVAQPRLFVGPSGHHLFSYGGWTGSGPKTDLHWASMADIRSGNVQFTLACKVGNPARRGGTQTLTPMWWGCEAP